MVNGSVLLQDPAGYGNANFLGGDVDTNWIQVACFPPRVHTQNILERHRNVSPFLKCAMIPGNHCSHVLLKKGYMLLLLT